MFELVDDLIRAFGQIIAAFVTAFGAVYVAQSVKKKTLKWGILPTVGFLTTKK